MPVGLFPAASLFISDPDRRSMTDISDEYELTTYRHFSSELSASPAGPLPVLSIFITFIFSRSITDTLSDHWLLT